MIRDVAAPFERITSLKHPAIQRARALQTPAGRAQAGQFLIEGEALIRHALAAHVPISDAFFLDTAEADPMVASALVEAGAGCYLLSRGLLTKIIGTGYDTSITAVAAVPMRVVAVDQIAPRGGPLLACERIQDPRNVGVLLRTAEAGGARAMILSADSADPFSRSAIRSSTGSILRLPLVVSSDVLADLRRLREEGMRLVAASAHGRTPIDQARLGSDCVMVVGNESEGVSAGVEELADDVVAIPVAGGASSFNVTVAAGILLYECLRNAGGRGLQAGTRPAPTG
jgi:TrmH family RNA methyltransferase